MTPRRKAEIARLREEGAQAFRDGKGRAAVPIQYQGTMNREHWIQGWCDADLEARERELESVGVCECGVVQQIGMKLCGLLNVNANDVSAFDTEWNHAKVDAIDAWNRNIQINGLLRNFMTITTEKNGMTVRKKFQIELVEVRAEAEGH